MEIFQKGGSRPDPKLWGTFFCAPKLWEKNKVETTASGAHFNLPGHCLANMKATILEQVKYNDEQ